MSKETKLIKNTIIYAIGNFGTKILSFLIVPLYTHYISTDDMGVYDLIVTTVTFMLPFLLLQMTDGVYRWLIDSKDDFEEIIKVSLSVVIINSTIALVLGIPILSFFDIRYGSLIVLMLIAQGFFSLLQQIARGLHRITLYAVSGIVHTGVFLLLNVLQIVLWGRGIEGLMQAQIISSSLGAIFIFVSEKRIRNALLVRFNRHTAKEMLVYSLPLIPNTICWSLVNMSDRYIIRYFLGNSANGIYSISYKFPTIIQTCTNFFYLAWQESAIEEFGSADRDSYYSKIFLRYYKLLFPLCIILLPITELYIKLFMSVDYHTAWMYTGFLYLGTVFSALSSFLGTGYQSSKKSIGTLTTTIVAAALNIVVNILFIEKFGIQAAAFSTFIAYFVLFIIRIFHTRKFFVLHINWCEFWCLCVLTIVSVSVYSYTSGFIIKTLFLILGGYLFIRNNLDIMMSAIKLITRRKNEKRI